jgi:hypothetical protein
MIDVAPMKWRLLSDVEKQLLDLGPALDRNRIDPALTDPRRVVFRIKLVAPESDVADDALRVDNQGDVRRGRYELSGDFGIKIADRSLRGPEHVPASRANIRRSIKQVGHATCLAQHLRGSKQSPKMAASI